VGADVRKVLTITEGARRGLGTASSDKITLKGDPLASFDVRGFVEPRSSSPTIPFPSLLKNLIVERPVPSAERCTLCYQCRDICPAGAISRAQGKMKVPSYDYNKCIRCYCCMEVCPEAAISLRRGRLQWVINLVSR
jgi:formate hydrogenlyase subunit 6/NADH:ubiquinone oxidoreductase subunit I